MRLTEKTENGAYWTKNSKGVRETLLFKEELIKLGEYEDIDESPEHLAKIKQAFEIIKKKKVDIPLFIRCRKPEDYNGICIVNGSSELAQEEWDLLQEVLL